MTAAHRSVSGSYPEIPDNCPVTAAAMWLAEQAKLRDGLRRELRERFDLDGDQIVEAVTLAAKFRICQRAFS